MKKIMFNDKYGLTKSVLEGRKTMTRRAVPEKLLEAYYDYDDYVNAVAPRDIPCTREYEKGFFLRRSRYKVGDIVAVAQSYKDAGYPPDAIQRARFKTDNRGGWQIGDFEIWLLPGWKNKMYTYPSMMPHRIRITNVRVERLQDISEEDCLREGIIEDCPGVQYSFPTEIGYCGQYPFYTPRVAFAALIDKVSGKGTWESNPWVFVYEFELVK